MKHGKCWKLALITNVCSLATPKCQNHNCVFLSHIQCVCVLVLKIICSSVISTFFLRASLTIATNATQQNRSEKEQRKEICENMENDRNQSLFSLSILCSFECFADSIPFKKDLFSEGCSFVCVWLPLLLDFVSHPCYAETATRKGNTHLAREFDTQIESRKR